MKKVYNCLIVLIALFAGSSCNDEWEDEQFEHYVSFKAPVGDKGCTNINIRYKKDGKVTYQLPLVVSGSTMNDQDLTVHVAVDPDTLSVFNQERFSTRTELYYRELPQKYYKFPETVNIAAGEYTSLLDIDFTLNDLDLVDHWILPITILDGSSYGYQSNMRKNYRKALLRILPFNDYSGAYSTTNMKVYFYKEPENGDDDDVLGDPMIANTRTAFVVDDNTIFFYAGLMDEDLPRDKRALYKIYVRFDENGALTLIPDNNEIEFEVPDNVSPSYTLTENWDDTRPYIKHKYVTLRFTYYFNDITSATVPIRYKVTGSLLMERKINTQIPDEDQAIEW